MHAGNGGSLWLRVIDTDSEEVTLQMRRGVVRVKVEPVLPADLLRAGALFGEVQRLLNAQRPDTEDERTALDHAEEEAAREAQTPEEVYAETMAWSARAFAAVRDRVTEVFDDEAGAWYPLVWVASIEQAQEVEPDSSAPQRALPEWMLTPTHVQQLLVAALGPAREVAGSIAPFRRERQ